MSEKNVGTIHGMYEAFNKGDYASVIAALDPEVEWRMAENFIYTGAKPKVGRQAVLEGFMRIAKDWEDFTVSPEAVHDAGDAVVAEGYYTGTIGRAVKKSGHSLRISTTCGTGAWSSFSSTRIRRNSGMQSPDSCAVIPDGIR